MYHFNENGVCLNPDRIELAKGSCIKLAEYEGKWAMGYDLDYVTGGVGSPCTNNWKEHQFPTRAEARAAAFKEAIAHMERQIRWYEHAITCKHSNCGYDGALKQCHIVMAALKANQVRRQQPIQLSLFD